MNRPGGRTTCYRRWRALADEYDPERSSSARRACSTSSSWCPFYGAGGDELQLRVQLPRSRTRHSTPSAARDRGGRRAGALPADVVAGAGPARTTTSAASPTRWCGGDERAIRARSLMLLTLRGTPFLYYGDEIGLPDVRWTRPTRSTRSAARRATRAAIATRAARRCRGPTSPAPASRAGVEPWLPFGDSRAQRRRQRDDPGSVLHLTRDLIALRRGATTCAAAPTRRSPAPDGAWAWRRGERPRASRSTSRARLRPHRLRGRCRGRDRPRTRRASARTASCVFARKKASSSYR